MSNVYLLWVYDTSKPETDNQFMGVFSTQQRAIDTAEINDWDSSLQVFIRVVEVDTNRYVNSIHMYASNGEDMTPTWIDNDGKVVQ